VDTGKRATLSERHRHIRGRNLISHAALGLSDGLITNLSFLSGLAGATSYVPTIRLAGIAVMLAGAVSMFFGGWLATRSERDLFRTDSNREASEIENEPDEERSELRSFYVKKGLTGEEADLVVNRITSDREKWLEDILVHELHLHKSEIGNAPKIGSIIGLSFLAGAFVPLVPYLFLGDRFTALVSSVVLALVFLFGAGAWKGKISGRKIWVAGLEMLAVGAVASAILYVIGNLLVFV
jgi:vacuolar iron transporter family protein